MTPVHSPAETSHAFLTAVKRGEECESFRTTIATMPEARLTSLDRERRAALAFWINLYNAFVQFDLERDPSLYERKRRFFGDDRHIVAGTTLSLDDIEHGILRSSKWKYGLGYVPRPFPSAFERTYRLDEVDPRIHFALNCGAESCPPILAYTCDSIDGELDASTRSFLDQSSAYDRDVGELWVSRLFLYYRGDFGGRQGVYEFLERYGVLEERDRPRVRYSEYDWTRHTGMYRFGSGEE